MASSSTIEGVFEQVHSAGKTFPETVGALMELGVTRYHVDFVSSSVTTYKPKTGGGSYEVHRIPIPLSNGRLDSSWDGAGIVNAIRLIQQRVEIKTYAEFTERCVNAGVAGYQACLTGKRVVYYGHNGDMHVEWFPGAEPGTK
ncbi:hypothetical protein DCS_04638 [Drechmeria coniospora]|uniref:DUF1398 domain-containing protein n=1 Tax=Drechmeria coniospora TaxID=98403 RepID=A0A151GKL1_DRECN|nr:hypothetical protein DCS_04638 [Drechmeria coniospora]KYK57626.1 hypothetical protein DCS_04638 [Drechmeria coniospora]